MISASDLETLEKIIDLGREVTMLREANKRLTEERDWLRTLCGVKV